MNVPDQYEVIVVGAGHAGCEAACAAANLGAKVLIITFDMEKIAQMSCNPAMGGIAKGQILREIDALGGQSAIIADKTAIQFRMLNLSKGPAMWSPRAQCDRMKFSAAWRKQIENTANLDIWQDEVVSLLIENEMLHGVVTRLGVTFRAKAVILANGTFLNGLIHVGRIKMEGGRIAEQPSKLLSAQLQNLGFEKGRMKTGTPPRIDGRSINFEKLKRQDPDTTIRYFSYLHNVHSVDGELTQRPCYIAYTNPAVHRILERGFVDSPMYNGTIQSIGPRYCPSIEDKLVTFAEKDAHHLFLEPEGEDTNEYYVNGFSSSLPWNVQWEAMRNVEGLENVKFFRPGYAIEYDFFPPTQLFGTLETKLIQNLYFAGQINGTTGYEEAAAQGLMAGMNAVLKIRGREPCILRRDQAYIGVLIDDLITKGVDEPYRMFTSRAEYRILLRQDNADERLTQLSYTIGLASEDRFKLQKEKIENRDLLIAFIKNFSVSPEQINSYLERSLSTPIRQKVKLFDLLMRPEINLNGLMNIIIELEQFEKKFGLRTQEIIEATEIIIKYAGYIEKEKTNAKKLERLEHIQIPGGFDFRKLTSLSMEARIKMSRIKPATIGQASRISGVTPTDLNILLVYFGRYGVFHVEQILLPFVIIHLFYAVIQQKNPR